MDGLHQRQSLGERGCGNVGFYALDPTLQQPDKQRLMLHKMPLGVGKRQPVKRSWTFATVCFLSVRVNNDSF